MKPIMFPFSWPMMNDRYENRRAGKEELSLMVIKRSGRPKETGRLADPAGEVIN